MLDTRECHNRGRRRMNDSKPCLQDNMIETLPMYVLYRYTNLISAKPNHWVALLQHG